jgi:hypothetical protein
MHERLHVKYTLFFSSFNEIFNFLNRFSKNMQISNLMKICSVGAELFHADRRTDMTKPIVAYRHFENAPKNWPS